MKEILKNLGLILIILGVVILSLAVYRETTTNAKLVISLVLVVGGLLGHILINRYID